MSLTSEKRVNGRSRATWVGALLFGLLVPLHRPLIRLDISPPRIRHQPPRGRSTFSKRAIAEYLRARSGRIMCFSLPLYPWLVEDLSLCRMGHRQSTFSESIYDGDQEAARAKWGCAILSTEFVLLHRPYIRLVIPPRPTFNIFASVRVSPAFHKL